MKRRWQADPSALELLASSGNPFDTCEYRRAFVSAYPGWREASFGARQADGTPAAIGMLRISTVAENVPLGYGGIVSDRKLSPSEASTFLDSARRAAHVRVLRSRWTPSLSTTPVEFGSEATTTSLLNLRSGAWRENAEPKALWSIRRAEGLNARVVVGRDPREFLKLYQVWTDPELMSRRRVAPRKVQHRASLVEAVAAAGLARFHDVVIGGEVVSSVLVLEGSGHWVAWLSVQSEDGRAAGSGYLHMASVLDAAAAARIDVVNLGSSVSSTGHELAGVLRYKRRLGATEAQTREVEIGRATAGIKETLKRLRRDHGPD